MTILIGFSAVNTANNLVYVVTSALLSFMLASGIAGRRNLGVVQVTVRLPDEIYAQTPAQVKISVGNTGRWMPCFLISVDWLGRGIFVPFIEPGGEVSRWVEVSFEDRGLMEGGSLRVASVFPFNFFVRFRHVPLQRPIVVFPRPERPPLPLVSRSRRKGRDSVTMADLGDDAELLSIREYRPGDPLKRIHWKSTAKTGRVQTKELSSLERREVYLRLEDLPGRDIEQKLRWVTFWVIRLTRRGIPVGLRIGDEDFPPRSSLGHKRRILKALALYGRS